MRKFADENFVLCVLVVKELNKINTRNLLMASAVNEDALYKLYFSYSIGVGSGGGGGGGAGG